MAAPQPGSEPAAPLASESQLAQLVAVVEGELLAGLTLCSPDPHNPVELQRVPEPWRLLGRGNFAAVLLHPLHPRVVVKVYAPGRPGIEEEVEVYRRLGVHPAFSRCLHAGDGYLVLRRLEGVTFYECLHLGIPIPPQAIRDIDAALAHVGSLGLYGHDVHGRNVILHEGRGRIVDVSDFLNPEPCRAWRDLRWAYWVLYRPLILPLRLRASRSLLNGVRRAYRIVRRLLGEGARQGGARSPAPGSGPAGRR